MNPQLDFSPLRGDLAVVRQHVTTAQFEEICFWLSRHRAATTQMISHLASAIWNIPAPLVEGKQLGYGDNELARLHYHRGNTDLYVVDHHTVPLEDDCEAHRIRYPAYGCLEFVQGLIVPGMGMYASPQYLDGGMELDETFHPTPLGDLRAAHRPKIRRGEKEAMVREAHDFFLELAAKRERQPIWRGD